MMYSMFGLCFLVHLRRAKEVGLRTTENLFSGDFARNIHFEKKRFEQKLFYVKFTIRLRIVYLMLDLRFLVRPPSISNVRQAYKQKIYPFASCRRIMNRRPNIEYIMLDLHLLKHVQQKFTLVFLAVLMFYHLFPNFLGL